MILFCITSFNSIMYDLLLEKNNSNEVVVITDRSDVAAEIREAGIVGTFVMPAVLNMSIEEIDAAFADVALPGIFGNATFNNTELPVYAVLSLDRLKFWFNNPFADKADRVTHSMRFTEVYLSLDLGSTLPWHTYWAATTWDAKIIGVQTENIRTPEFLNFIKLIDLDTIIVTEDNSDFIKGICDASIITKKEIGSGMKEVEFQSREELRKGFGIASAEKVAGVLFDKRDEWQCRKWLRENADEYNRIFVYPVDQRSSELADSVLRLHLDKVDISHNKTTLNMCDNIIAFRFYYREFGMLDIDYVDYYNINMVDKLSQGVS